MKKLIDLEFFEEGDYTALGKEKWTKEDFEKAYENFKKSGIDIPIILNSKDAHDEDDKKNVARLGFLKEIWRKPNGKWSGNGEFLKEAALLLEKKLYDHKSVWLNKSKDGKKVEIKHIALCGLQKPQIKNLKLNHLSIFEDGTDCEIAKSIKRINLFSQNGEGFEFTYKEEDGLNVDSPDNLNVDYQKNKNQNDGSTVNVQDKNLKSKEKEKVKMADITNADVQLAEKNAVEQASRDFKRDMADQETKFTAKIKEIGDEVKSKTDTIEAKDNEIALFKETISEKDTTIVDLNKKVEKLKEEKEELKVEFAKSQEETIKKEVAVFVYTCNSIEPRDKPGKFKILYDIRLKSEDAYKEMVKFYEDQSPIKFGVDEKMTGGSDFEKIVSEYTDKMGNVGLNINTLAMGDKYLQELEQ
jgi:hypothetical protein